MDKQKRKPTIGEAFRQLDAAGEHASHAWHMLLEETGQERKTEGWPPTTKGFKPGTAAYHAAALIGYTHKALEILRAHVPGEWQLCPYQDCCWGCGVEDEGFYICPHCGRIFYAESSDSDYEDVKLRRYNPQKDPPTPPADLAYDFGPTRGTPEGDKP